MKNVANMFFFNFQNISSHTVLKNYDHKKLRSCMIILSHYYDSFTLLFVKNKIKNIYIN